MKKLMILNGSLFQVPLIKAAKEEGYYTIVCDRTSTNPGIKLADKHYQLSVLDFDAVLEAVLEDPEHTEIINDHGEYSEQEIRMVEGIKRAAEFVHLHRRPMTNAELRENRTQKT